MDDRIIWTSGNRNAVRALASLEMLTPFRKPWIQLSIIDSSISAAASRDAKLLRAFIQSMHGLPPAPC